MAIKKKMPQKKAVRNRDKEVEAKTESADVVSVDEETKEKQKEQVAGTPVPDSIYADRKKNDGRIEVKESFFSRHSSGFDPGKARDGTILNHRNYCKSEADLDGTPVEYRWGSKFRGCPNRNQNRGYVPARVNKETAELDPNGDKVTVGGMTLLVRKKEHGDMMRQLHKEQTLRSTRKKKAEANEMTKSELKGLAKRLGMEDRLLINEKSEEKVFEPRRED